MKANWGAVGSREKDRKVPVTWDSLQTVYQSDQWSGTVVVGGVHESAPVETDTLCHSL